MKKKVDIFLILCLKLLQVKKAISYHLIIIKKAIYYHLARGWGLHHLVIIAIFPCLRLRPDLYYHDSINSTLRILQSRPCRDSRKVAISEARKAKKIGSECKTGGRR